MVESKVADWLADSVQRWPHPENGPWLVAIRWRAHAGHPVCTGLHIDLMPDADTEPLSALRVRELPVGRLIKQAREERFYASGGGLSLASDADQLRALGRRLKPAEVSAHAWSAEPRRRRRSLTNEHYDQVADTYLRAKEAGMHPTLAVMNAMYATRPTASRWVREARARGLIPPMAPSPSVGRLGQSSLVAAQESAPGRPTQTTVQTPAEVVGEETDR